MENSMFCFQCQEAAKGIGCISRGVCGKTSEVSAAMDLLLFSIRGVAIASTSLKKAGEKAEGLGVDSFITEGLFATITNANFDINAIVNKVEQGFMLRDLLIKKALEKGCSLPKVDEIEWQYSGIEEGLKKAALVGVKREPNEDIRSLKELVLYGLKGMAAYVCHAFHLGFDQMEIHSFIQTTLSDMAVKSLTIDDLVSLTIKTGEYGVKAMSLLDEANTKTYGNPEITQVNIGVRNHPGILISGHDLKDLEELLQQTAGTGVDVYTHSEMLPAHYYPAFKKYEHFVGNYGSSWWHQRDDFESFNGPILFTTNCIVPPLSGATYTNRMFTTNASGYPGCKHIVSNVSGKKDFSDIIDIAKKCSAPTKIEDGFIVGGFAHNQVFLLADKVVNAIKEGKIRKFIVMAGCDGRMKDREYYTEFARKLPQDTVILTAGCAKYRYNKLQLGDIDGIPRVLDAGQCNDSYSLALIALKLKEVFNLNDINDLPIIYNIAWYEQKAVIVLLALLSLGVKNIHLGPTLPAFLSPNIANALVASFGIGSITTAEEDMKRMLS